MLPPLSERKPLPAHAHHRALTLPRCSLAGGSRRGRCRRCRPRGRMRAAARRSIPKTGTTCSRPRRCSAASRNTRARCVVSIGPPDENGRSLMNLVPVENDDQTKLRLDDEHAVHRIWLDADQARRLQEGRYFATVVRTQEFLLDPRRPERRSRLLHGQRRRAVRQPPTPARSTTRRRASAPSKGRATRASRSSSGQADQPHQLIPAALASPMIRPSRPAEGSISRRSCIEGGLQVGTRAHNVWGDYLRLAAPTRVRVREGETPETPRVCP